jgi:hypothetical protein
VFARSYSFYDHMVVTRMLPLQRAVWWTRYLQQEVRRGVLAWLAWWGYNLVVCSFLAHPLP